VSAASGRMETLERLLVQLEEASREVGLLVRDARNEKAGMPAMLREGNQILADVRSMTRDLRSTTPRAPSIARNVEESAENLPGVLQQTQLTALQLEKLLTQLRGHWLFGGNGAPSEPMRLPATQARP